MKNKGLQTLLYSAAGIAVMALILVAFNLISGAFKVRMDLTEEKAYTLSDGTRAILSQSRGPDQDSLLLHPAGNRLARDGVHAKLRQVGRGSAGRIQAGRRRQALSLKNTIRSRIRMRRIRPGWTGFRGSCCPTDSASIWG